MERKTFDNKEVADEIIEILSTHGTTYSEALIILEWVKSGLQEQTVQPPVR